MKAVAYARFSTDKQREESITAQLRAIHEYAKKHQIEIVKEYCDEGRSATTDERPAFQRMISELKQLKPNFVLVHKLDRFARDRFDAAFYRREIQKAGAKLIAVDQDFGDSPESVLLESLVEGMAEYYSKNLAREVMKGMKENAYKAQFNGGWVPLGYDIDENKRYVVNEKEAAAVRLIFSLKLKGYSYSRIAEELNEKGYKTKRGRPFGKNSIYEILRNEKYCGTYIFNETPKKIHGKRNNRIKKPAEEIIKVEGGVPSIISRQDWERVQKMLDSKKLTTPRKASTVYILTGILKCCECGSAMTGQSITRKTKDSKKKYYYYMCSNAKRKAGCSHTKQHPKELLENKVLEAIEERVTKIKDVPFLADKLWEEIQKINAERDTELEDVRRQLKEVQKTLDNYTRAIEKGVAIDFLVDKINEAGRQKKQLEKIIAERRSPFADITKQDVVRYLRSQSQLTIDRSDLEKCKKTVADCIESITVFEDSSIQIMFKYNFGTDKTGVGGGT